MEDSQRTHRGFAEGSQRIHGGPTEESERCHREFTKVLQKDLPSETVQLLAVPRRVLALKTSQDEHSRRVFKLSLQDVGPNSRQRRADLQDVATSLGAFVLEPRRHKTLPYAPSPDYVK